MRVLTLNGVAQAPESPMTLLSAREWIRQHKITDENADVNEVSAAALWHPH